MKAKSFQVSETSAVASALEEAMEDGYAPTVAFVFMSQGLDPAQVTVPLKEHGIEVFGANSYGEFTDQGSDLGAIAVLLLDLAPAHFLFRHSLLANGTERETTQRIAEEAFERFSNPVFLLVCSHLETVAEDLIAGIESVGGPKIGIYGAMAGFDLVTPEHCVFTSDTVLERGVVVMVLDGNKVEVSGVATCGWKPVGTVKTVTKSDGMWVREIDNQPALDLMLKYSGVCTREQITLEIWMQEFAMSLPPQLIREEGANVMRPSLMYDLDSNSVMCNGRVPEGAQFRFSLPPDDDVIYAVIDACKGLKEAQAQDADAILYFSCAGRILSLGPLMKREIASVQQLWDVPMAGFYSTGEIARATGGRNELNNATSCCVVLKEK